MPILAFMNRYLKHHSKDITDFREFESFLRCLFALCYYKCSVLDVETHPKTHPLVADNVKNLKGNTFKQSVRRLNTLLRSFQGTEKARPADCGDSIWFPPIYDHDRELEKLFRDMGGHVSGLAFVLGLTQLIIDDDKTRMRSSKVAELSLVRSKSKKAFGGVANCTRLFLVFSWHAITPTLAMLRLIVLKLTSRSSPVQQTRSESNSPTHWLEAIVSVVHVHRLSVSENLTVISTQVDMTSPRRTVHSCMMLISSTLQSEALHYLLSLAKQGIKPTVSNRNSRSADQCSFQVGPSLWVTKQPTLLFTEEGLDAV